MISSCRLVIQYDTCFPALRCRFRSRFRNRFRKNRVRTCRSVCRCWGVCSALARQAQEAGGRVSCAKEWAELQASWLRTERQVRKIELDPIWTDQRQRRTYGNRERYFLRELRSSYGILTYERNCYVLLQRTTAIRQRNAGNHAWRRELANWTRAQCQTAVACRCSISLWHVSVAYARHNQIGVIRKLKNPVMMVERMQVGGSDGLGRGSNRRALDNACLDDGDCWDNSSVLSAVGVIL